MSSESSISTIFSTAGTSSTETTKSTSSSTLASGSSSSSGSSLDEGCVSCDNNVTCPQCAEDEYCATTSLSCTECPRTYCAKKVSSSQGNGSASSSSSSLTNLNGAKSSSSSSKVGPIVGGVIGGVAFVVIVGLLGFLYYRYYKRKRSAIPEDSEYMEKPAMLREISTGSGSRPRNRRNRNSAATIQTSTASNIIPVAYIPGVTTNLTKKNLRKGGRLGRKYYQDSDRKSHITLGSSILGDDDDELLNRDRDAQEWGTDGSVSTNKNSEGPDLTTAIRARPKLVQIDELAEDDDDDEEEEEKQEGREQAQIQHALHTHGSDTSATHGLPQYLSSELQSSSQQGVRRASTTSSNDPRDPFQTDRSRDETFNSSDSNSEGSFILDVEMPDLPKN